MHSLQIFLGVHKNLTKEFPVALDSNRARPIARIDFGGCRTPKMGTFWTQKVDLLNLTHLNPLTNAPFFAHFVAKSGSFGRFEGVHCTPAPPWLRAWTGLCLHLCKPFSFLVVQCTLLGMVSSWFLNFCGVRDHF